MIFDDFLNFDTLLCAGLVLAAACFALWVFWPRKPKPERQPFTAQEVANAVEWMKARMQDEMTADLWKPATAPLACEKPWLVDQYTLWRRDSLLSAEGELTDEDFLNRWRGKVPQKPKPVAGHCYSGWTSTTANVSNFQFDYGGLSPVEKQYFNPQKTPWYFAGFNRICLCKNRCTDISACPNPRHRSA